MRILVHSANLGGFEKVVEDVPQNLPHGFSMETYRFTDDNFPPRKNSMTPRLQARIPKMFGWQFFPLYDYYLWIDSSCRLSNPDSVEWFLNKLSDHDIAVFKHPDRDVIQQEADYLKERLELEAKGKKKKYILPRYEGEDIDGQLEAVFVSQPLYASTAFIYRNTPEVQQALKEWWYQTSRFHSIDQLSMTYALRVLNVKVIHENYLKCDYIEAVRK